MYGVFAIAPNALLFIVPSRQSTGADWEPSAGKKVDPVALERSLCASEEIKDIDNYTWGSHAYNGRNIYTWTYPDFEKQEINNNRPFLLNMDNGGSAEDKSKDYNDHSVTVVGYKDNAEYLEIRDTWDDCYHYFAWGNWSSCMYTKVTTS